MTEGPTSMTAGPSTPRKMASVSLSNAYPSQEAISYTTSEASVYKENSLRIEEEDGSDDVGIVDEIYDIVDAVVPRTDDPTLPALTFRVLILGPIFCIVLSCLNTLFTFRTNQFVTSPFIGVLLAYPIGLFMSRTLPTKVFRICGFPLTLNPGNFNYKEHTLIYVFCSTGASTAYALLQHYWTEAGLCRRYLVRPASMLWPANLSIVAMLNSLHETTEPADSKGRSACHVLPSSGTPSLFRLLGSAQVNGGLGMLSLSFDWNVISSMAPITSPLWALCNQILDVIWIMVWIIVPILWSNSAFGIDRSLGADPDQGPNGTGRLYNTPDDAWQNPSIFPLGQVLNTPLLFNKDGIAIQTRRFVFRENMTLDQTFYDAQKPIYISTLFAIEYTASFIVFAAAISHVALWYGKDIFSRFRTSMSELDQSDIHAKLMDVYPDVPDLWICVGMVGGGDGVGVGDFVGAAYWNNSGDFRTADWLNVMSEFLIGLILPGRIVSVMSFKTLSYMSMYQGLASFRISTRTLYEDPARTMFGVQLFSTILSAIINVFTACFIYESFGKSSQYKVDPNDPSSPFAWKLQHIDELPLGWSCKPPLPLHPPTNPSSNNSNKLQRLPQRRSNLGGHRSCRFFGPGSPYQYTLFGFLIGLSPPSFPGFSIARSPTGGGTGSIRSDMITPLFLGILVNYYVKRYRHMWWKKYAYVLSAALDSGLAVTLTLVFVAFQSNANFQIPSQLGH
ncbi:OPT oligopeptide transporter protein-domain-containing protein [Chytridium lagenaria]|nr:OPT oligopeptide transporter protein-domain-containing protein [Chytridium lagenaria]